MTPTPTTIAEILDQAADHIAKFGHMRVGEFTGAWYYFGSETNDRRTSSASLTGAIRVVAGVPTTLLDAEHKRQPRLVREAIEFLASLQPTQGDPHTAVFELNAVLMRPELAEDALRAVAERHRNQECGNCGRGGYDSHLSDSNMCVECPTCHRCKVVHEDAG